MTNLDKHPAPPHPSLPSPTREAEAAPSGPSASPAPAPCLSRPQLRSVAMGLLLGHEQQAAAQAFLRRGQYPPLSRPPAPWMMYGVGGQP